MGIRNPSFYRNAERYSRIPDYLVTFIMASLATLVAKRPRIVISNAQKKALRTWYYAPGIKKTLAEASTWWYF
jgi:hypothetical protein